MNDDLESRLRRSLGERGADPVRGEPSLPDATRRRARRRRLANAGSAVAAIGIVLGVTMTLVSPGTVSVPPASSLPSGSPTRVPEPSSTAAPTPAAVAQSPARRDSLDRVAEIPDAGAKIAAHDAMWVVATTRVLAYSFDGRLRHRVVVTDFLGGDAVLEPRVVADDDTGIWVAGIGEISATTATDACGPIEPLGGDRDGEAFVVRIDAATRCPSILIDLGTATRGDGGLGLIPSPSPASTPPSRLVRWHGLAVAAGSLWIGADGGMLQVDLATGARTELGIDAYSVGVGFGSVWAAVSQSRGTPEEESFIARIDPASGQVAARIDVPPRGPAATTDFAEVHVGPDAVWAEGWGIVAQIDAGSNQIVARYEIGGRHLHGDMASGDGRFYLPDNGDGATGYWEVDASRRRLLRKVTTEAAVSGIAVTGSRLWFSVGGLLVRTPR